MQIEDIYLKDLIDVPDEWLESFDILASHHFNPFNRDIYNNIIELSTRTNIRLISEWLPETTLLILSKMNLLHLIFEIEYTPGK